MSVRVIPRRLRRRPGLAAALAVLLARYSRAPSNQETRERILARLASCPGALCPALAKELGVGETTVRYHLGLLEREGAIVRRCVQRRNHYFLRGASEALAADAIGAIYADGALRLREIVLARPGISVSEACAASGLTRMTVHYHVRRLACVGLLRVERRGLRFFLHPQDAAAREPAQAPALAAR